MKRRLLEKKRYTFDELQTLITDNGTLHLQDLINTRLDDYFFTLFINHTVVIKDVVNLSFLSYHDRPDFIHGIVDVYDRVIREELYNLAHFTGGPLYLENDHLTDIAIRSNIVINVLELNVSNFVQDSPGNSIPLFNKYLVELYTDWHTQLHFKDQEFFKLFFK